VTTTELAPPTLVGVLEELVLLVRRLPAEPAIGMTAATALRAVAAEGPQRISDLAERLGVSQPGATQLVARMVDDGLVERREDPTDGRVVRIGATRHGRAVIAQRRESRSRALDELVGRLSRREQQQLQAAIPVLDRLAHLTA